MNNTVNNFKSSNVAFGMKLKLAENLKTEILPDKLTAAILNSKKYVAELKPLDKDIFVGTEDFRKLQLKLFMNNDITPTVGPREITSSDGDLYKYTSGTQENIENYIKKHALKVSQMGEDLSNYAEKMKDFL